MKTVLIIVSVVVAIIVVGFVALVIRSKLMEIGHTTKIVSMVDAVVDKLGTDPTTAEAELAKLAENPETRNTFFERLTATGNVKHFPADFHSQEAFAESDLVFWLCHPNELKSAPAKIELMAKIKKELVEGEGEVEFYVFRFCVNKSHWAAEYGWMAGITGPYTPGNKPEIRSRATFSEMEPYDAKTPVDHVDYLLSKQSTILVK